MPIELGEIPNALRSELGDLSTAESFALRVLGEQDRIVFGSETIKGDHKISAPPDQPAIIRASLLRWLLTSTEAVKRSSPQGLTVAGATIVGQLSLDGCTLVSRFGLASCNVPDGINLQWARCRSLMLSDCEINHLLADGLQVDGAFIMRRAKISGECRLINMVVKGPLICDDSEFQNPGAIALGLDATRVFGMLSLARTKVEGEARVAGVIVDLELNLEGAIFSNPEKPSLTLQDTAVGCGLYMRKGFSLDGYLNLENASVRTLIDDEACWPANGRLLLHGFTYDHFSSPDVSNDAKTRLRWLGLQGKKQQSANAFTQLAMAYAKVGQREDSRKVLLEREKWITRSVQMPWWKRLSNYIFEITVGYGLQGWRLVVWVSVLVLLGCTLFGAGNKSGHMSPTSYGRKLDQIQGPTLSVGQAPRGLKEGLPRFNALAYSLDCFVPVLDLKQDGYWHPEASSTCGWWLRTYYWTHVSVGWLLTTVLVSVLTGVVGVKIPRE